MNNFSFNRFCKTFRWYMSVDLHSLLAWLVGISVGTFLGELLFMALNANQVMPGFFTVFILITYGVMLSLLFYNLNNKPRRAAFLMLPATHLEKYLSAVFYVTVVWGLGILLAFVVGDMMRMVFCSLALGDEWVSAGPKVAKSLIPNTMFHDEMHVYSLSYRVMNLVVGYSFIMWFHSLYTLGGTVLRKYAFVAASVVLILSLSLLSWFINHFDISMFASQWDGNAYVGEEVGVVAYVLAVVMPLLSVFNYWASFQVFKGFQLITNKWTNYDFYK